MKDSVLLLTVCCLFSLTGKAQEMKEIKLNAPDKDEGGAGYESIRSNVNRTGNLQIKS